VTTYPIRLDFVPGVNVGALGSNETVGFDTDASGRVTAVFKLTGTPVTPRLEKTTCSHRNTQTRRSQRRTNCGLATRTGLNSHSSIGNWCN